MKRLSEALVAAERKKTTGAARCAVVVAAALATTAPAAQAVAPVARLQGSASLTRFSAASRTVAAPARFHVRAVFGTDTPGAELFTIGRAVIFFPDSAGTNGRLFRSCGAAQIERFRGAVGRCPRGSRIGGGTLRAQAIQLGITVPGRVALFNGPGGRSITFNIQASRPVRINESIDAPLTQLRGRYGEKLTLVVPASLQEITDGIFAGLRVFDVTIGGSVRVRGVDHSYLRATTCPRWALHGVFDMKNWTTGQSATTTADTKVRCTGG